MNGRIGFLVALVLGTLAVASAGPATAQVPPVPLLISVSLSIDASAFPVSVLRESKTCNVLTLPSVPVSALLDLATVQGCIAGWTWIVYPSSVTGLYGRFVTGIDGRLANCDLYLPWFLLTGQAPPFCTFWGFTVNGNFAEHGVDFEFVQPGNSYGFGYVVVTSPITI